jgi:hypothetical protein
MTCLHPKDLDDRHERGLAINSANRQNGGRAAARQHHRDELQRQRISGCVSHTVATSISIILCSDHCVTARLRLRTAGILDARLGRDTLTREPLDAATSPLLMTFRLHGWLATGPGYRPVETRGTDC